MEQNPSSSSRVEVDRKTVEKNRRNHMKALYSQLHSLLPHHPSREAMSLPDQLGEAANYIKKLERVLEEMKEKRNSLVRVPNPNIARMRNTSNVGGMMRPPQIEIHEMGSTLEVVLTTGLDCQPIFKETIRLIHEEGAEVVSASFSAVGDTVFHTIHSKVGESGLEYCGAAKIAEKLRKFIYDAGSFD